MMARVTTPPKYCQAASSPATTVPSFWSKAGWTNWSPLYESVTIKAQIERRCRVNRPGFFARLRV